MSKTLEVVTFRLNTGVSEAEFRQAVAPVVTFLARQDGYVRFTLANKSDGSWVNCVEWRDLASAKAASEIVMTAPDCRAMMAAIDPSTVVMDHFDIQSRAG